MATILNLASTKTDQAFDSKEEGTLSIQTNDIHIRIQQRSGRKTLTTIQGKEYITYRQLFHFTVLRCVLQG